MGCGSSNTDDNAVKKTDDKVIASNHEKRIKKLEELAHPQKELVCKCCKKQGE